MLCPKCNNEIPDNSNCCGYCGEKLNDDALQNVFNNPVVPVSTSPKKKKNTANIILISVIVVLLAAIIVICAIFLPDYIDKSNKNSDEETKKVHQVDDKDEDKYELDENGEIVTDENNEPVTRPHNSGKNDENDDTTESFEDIYEDIQNGEITTGEVQTMPEGTVVNKNKKLLEKAFSSGKFYVDASLDNELGLPMGIVFASNGEALCYNINFNAYNIMKMDISMLYKDGTMYMMDNESKIYCEAATGDSAEMEDMIGSMFDTSAAGYIKTTEVTTGGKTYICEEYSSGRYYFDKSTEQLKRIETDDSGETMVILVNEFTKNPDSSVFSVPSKYKKVTPEEFESSMGDIFGGLGM